MRVFHRPRMRCITTRTSSPQPILATLAEAVAFALRFFEGRKRNRDADIFRAALAAERVVRHLDRAGFIVMNLQATTFHAGTHLRDRRDQQLL